MTSPSEPRSDEPEEPVSLDKPSADATRSGTTNSGTNPGTEPAAAPFDPYRFGLPETLPPPEYAPPGWTPPANGPWATTPSAPSAPSAAPHGPAWAPPYAGGPGQPGQHPYGGGPAAHRPFPGGQPPYGSGQQPYPRYPYGTSHYRAATGSNGKAVAALVLGILAILMCWMTVFDAVFALPAVVLGIVGLNQANRSGGNGKGMAIAGIVCGALGAVLAIVVTAVVVHAVNQCGGFQQTNLPGFQQCLQNHLTGSLQ